MKKIYFLTLFLIAALGTYAQAPTFTINNNSYTSFICNTSTINLTATSSFTGYALSYSWDGPSASYTGSNVGISQPGNYTVTAYNTANSFSTTQTYSISAGANTIAPTAQINNGSSGNFMITCSNPSVTLVNTSTAGGPPTNPPTIVSVVSWEGPIPQMPSGPAATYTALTPGVYTLTVVKQNNGCTAQAFAFVSDGRIYPVFNSSSFFSLSCPASTVTIYATPVGPASNISYNWTGPVPGSVSSATSHSPVVNAAGTYVLIATNTTSGCNTMVQVMVNPCTSALAITNVTNTSTLTCATTSINLTATAPNYTGTLSYSWTNGTLTPLTGSNVVIMHAGVYTVTATNAADNYTETAQYTISSNVTTPTVSAASQPFIVNCSSPTVAIYASYTSPGANDAYSWTKPAGATVSALNTSTIVTDSPGQYVVTVTNTLSACTASAQVMVAACIDGIHENKSNPVFISPNPNNGEFTLRRANAAPAHIELYTITGTLVKKQDLPGADVKISMADCAPGIYILQVFEAGQAVKQIKLVKE